MLFKLRTIPLALAALYRAACAFVLRRRMFVSAEEQYRRETICSACPYYVSESKQCEHCTCYVPLKSSLSTEACPKKFW